MTIGFTGHKHNDYIKLIYMGARWFLPGLGRFASADTIVPDTTNPQSYNRYSYVRNNPLKYNDPTGHRECGSDNECSFDKSIIVPTSLPPAWGDPINGYYLSGTKFIPGDKDEAGTHNGVDLKGDSEDVFALAEGIVRVADACDLDPPCEGSESEAANYGTGNVVIIEYVYDVLPERIREALGLEPGDSVYVQYQHLDSISENIVAGAKVRLGDVIGQYGNTGNSKGAHLHLEIHVGSSGVLGQDNTDGTYKTHNSAWHNQLTVVDPNLIWDDIDYKQE